MVEELAEGFGKEAAGKKISFIFEMPPGPVSQIEADKERMKQALGNVLGNAIKFNREGGKVVVKLVERDSMLLLSVQDTGIGISKEAEKHIFEKFHRGTDTLTYNYGGVGLGLYTTRLIIEAHRGKIWFESIPGQGSTFFVQLPAKVGDSRG
jgi:signal transduction histidine kinase